LERIAEVCQRTPRVKHWLPTRERSIVREYVRRRGALPDNLVVRLSATMVDGDPPNGWRWTSTVSSIGSNVHGRLCPASMQENQCGHCRACWDKRVVNVTYHAHWRRSDNLSY
jgi:hypothetical protein